MEIITICSICDKIIKPKEAIGLTGKWIQADIETFNLQEIYKISHGLCQEHYTEAMKKVGKYDYKTGRTKQ